MATTFEDLVKIGLFNIKKEDFENRFIPLFPIFRENWEMYIDTEKGLLPLKIVDSVDGFYISKNYVKTDDLYLLFLMLCLNEIILKQI